MLEPLAMPGNPRLACDCGRIQQADMFVFYDGAYICDGCWTGIRRTTGLDAAKVARDQHSGPIRMPRETIVEEPGRRGQFSGKRVRFGPRIAEPG